MTSAFSWHVLSYVDMQGNDVLKTVRGLEPYRNKDLSFWLSHLPPQKSEVPLDYDKNDPEQKHIYRFVRTLFSSAQLTAECAIVTLVRHVNM